MQWHMFRVSFWSQYQCVVFGKYLSFRFFRVLHENDIVICYVQKRLCMWLCYLAACINVCGMSQALLNLPHILEITDHWIDSKSGVTFV